jgi:hypothetical protein
MDTRLPTQTEPGLDTETGRVLQVSPSPKWHAPVITRIDIKRTMSGGTSFMDGVSAQSSA